MNKLEESGVYFDTKDCANFFMRLVIIIVDGGIVIGSFLVFFDIEESIFWSTGNTYSTSLIIWLGFLYLYLVEMKRRCGSLGNMVTSTKLVSLHGTIPSISSMITRSVISIFLSIPLLLIDWVWMLGDPSRQMVRDKFTGVYVVKKGRSAAGNGKFTYSNYMLAGFNLIFKEVKRNKNQPVAEDDGQ